MAGTILTITCQVLLFPLINGNSRGIGVPCNVDVPVGSDDVNTKSNAAMWWAHKAKWGAGHYTLRTGDGEPSQDPLIYTPGHWTQIYIRSLIAGKQFTGLILYAENKDGKKVGEWKLHPKSSFHQPGDCVVHRNADFKKYLEVFKVRIPSGAGTVVIKALLKYGLAFPVKDGGFFWPASSSGPTQHLLLTESLSVPSPIWIEGQGTESCDQVCSSIGRTCDINILKDKGQSSALWGHIRSSTACFEPLMAGCSGSSPAVGPDGCFYHDATCQIPESPHIEERYCSINCGSWPKVKGECCTFAVHHLYKGQCHCAEATVYSEYNENWSKGWPSDYIKPTTPTPPKTQPLTCDAQIDWNKDARRICACTDGNPPPTVASTLSSTKITNIDHTTSKTDVLTTTAPPSGTGCCSWNACGECPSTTEFCRASKENCEGSCNGMWCDNGHSADVGGGDGGGDGVSTTPTVDNTGYAIEHGKLKLDGVHLVDEKGERIQLMGMSSHGLQWFDNCYTKESIAFLVKNWGINIFRAAMYIGENGYATKPHLADKVDQIVEWCEDLGVYVMIDWHVLTPGDPNAWLTSQGASTGLAIDYWKSVATKYKDKKHVLYETANEPNGVSWDVVKAYHDAIIPVIRSIDPETIIIAGTTTWSQDIHLAADNPVAMPYNVMYAFHFYAGSHLSLLDRVKQFAPKIPIFVTEWGTSSASGDGGPFLDVAKKFLDVFADIDGSTGVKLSWAQWSYADKNEKSAALATSACSRKAWDDASDSGSYLREYIKANVAVVSKIASTKKVVSATTRSTFAPTSSFYTTFPQPATSVMTSPKIQITSRDQNMQSTKRPSIPLTSSPAKASTFSAMPMTSQKLDPCCPNPCGPHGQCNGAGQCTCRQGWTGSKCEVDPCKADSCSGHGSCTGHGSSFVCKCTGGWAGKGCNIDPDTKPGHPIQAHTPTNTGECATGNMACGGSANAGTSSNCCPPGYLCFEKDQFWSSCRKADDCMANSINPNDPPQYQTPWSCRVRGGSTCANCAGNSFGTCQNKETNECFTKISGQCPVATFECPTERRNLGLETLDQSSHNDVIVQGPLLRRLSSADATCMNGKITGSVCSCNPGYEGGGVWKFGPTYPSCEKVDYCAPNPCLNGGKCQELPITLDRGTDEGMGYVCQCNPGYSGFNCHICSGKFQDSGENTDESDDGGSVRGNSNEQASDSSHPLSPSWSIGLAFASTLMLSSNPLSNLGLICLGAFWTLPSAHAHNWMTSPARGNEAGENNGFNGFQSPPGPQRSSRIHTQVGPGQLFPVEWAAGHGFGSHTYLTVVKAEHEAMLAKHTISLLDDYINNAPEDARDYLKQYDVHHVSGSPHSHPLLTGNNIADTYNWIPSLGDDFKGKRPAVFRQGPGNHFANLNVKKKTWTEGQDARVKYTSEKYPWIISAHRFLMKYDYPKDADTTMLEIPPEYGPGRYLVHYMWSGYYDIVDINVLDEVSKDVFGRKGDNPSGYDRTDHCRFVSGYEGFSVLNCKGLGSSDRIDACECGPDCDGIQVVSTKLEPTIQKTGIAHPSLPSECAEAQIGFERVCYAVKQGVPQVGPSYRISADPEDPVFFSSCYTKASGWQFLQTCANCPSLTIEPGWIFGSKCISCADMRRNTESGNFVPTWRFLDGDICRSCDFQGR